MTNDLFFQRVRIADDVLLRELDGESVLLDLNSERYYGLDEVGTRMWQLLAGSSSVEDAYQSLLKEYDVEPERLRQDMRDLLSELVDNGLIKLE
jgi:hypothetical protein